MKAALALLVLYVGTFFVAWGSGQQGAAGTEAVAAGQTSGAVAVDPAKEADIRELLQFAGFTEILKSEGERTSAEYAQRIRSTVKDRARAKELRTVFEGRFRKRYSAAEISAELVQDYDRNFSAEEIQQLLEFYSSPLGRKFGVETTRMSEEMRKALSARSESAAQETWEALQAESAEPGADRTKR